MNAPIILGTRDAVDVPCLIEVDDYVPLRFRTYNSPIGAAYFRIGNFTTSLVELIVDSISGLLRGVTLVSFDTNRDWPIIGEVAIVDGLPMISANWNEEKRIDLVRDFYVSMQSDSFLIAWGDVTQLSARADFGNVRFLIADSELAGIQFVELTESQVTMLTSHITQDWR